MTLEIIQFTPITYGWHAIYTRKINSQFLMYASLIPIEGIQHHGPEHS